ncbi:MAG: hypothetical protein AABW73_03555 [Nanoarchaeota archaeon]
MQLLEYLQTHQDNCGRGMGGRRAHKRVVNIIERLNPRILGLFSRTPRDFLVFKEVLCRSSGTQDLGCLDLVFFSPEEMFVFEAKASHGAQDGRIRRVINPQLSGAYNFLQSNFDQPPRLIGAYLPYKKMELEVYEINHSFGSSLVRSTKIHSVRVAPDVFTQCSVGYF